MVAGEASWLTLLQWFSNKPRFIVDFQVTLNILMLAGMEDIELVLRFPRDCLELVWVLEIAAED